MPNVVSPHVATLIRKLVTTTENGPERPVTGDRCPRVESANKFPGVWNGASECVVVVTRRTDTGRQYGLVCSRGPVVVKMTISIDTVSERKSVKNRFVSASEDFFYIVEHSENRYFLRYFVLTYEIVSSISRRPPSYRYDERCRVANFTVSLCTNTATDRTRTSKDDARYCKLLADSPIIDLTPRVY